MLIDHSRRIFGRRGTVSRASAVVKADGGKTWPDALLFDCDGVLVDTEPDGHRIAFNEAFRQKGIKHEWGLELYGELLQTGGGKERMMAYFTDHENEEPFLSIKDAKQRQDLVKELHLLKTDIFMKMVESGMMPLRPGVQRLIGEAMAKSVPVAVCSTSNERAVSTIVRVLLGPEVIAKMRVFAGDVVKAKKPSPDIYNLAAETLDVNPSRCVVIEDSQIGLRAAKAAGMRCIVTESRYTAGEDFESADAVKDCIGDGGDERFSLDDLAAPGIFWQEW